MPRSHIATGDVFWAARCSAVLSMFGAPVDPGLSEIRSASPRPGVGAQPRLLWLGGCSRCIVYFDAYAQLSHSSCPAQGERQNLTSFPTPARPRSGPPLGTRVAPGASEIFIDRSWPGPRPAGRTRTACTRALLSAAQFRVSEAAGRVYAVERSWPQTGGIKNCRKGREGDVQRIKR